MAIGVYDAKATVGKVIIMMNFSYSPLSTEAMSEIGRGAISFEWLQVFDGLAYRVTYPNGYGASIIKHYGSYGHDDDLWELGVLKDGKLCCDTDITGDVLGYLTEAEVIGLCRDIFYL